jgi:hypothetical protein
MGPAARFPGSSEWQERPAPGHLVKRQPGRIGFPSTRMKLPLARYTWKLDVLSRFCGVRGGASCRLSSPGGLRPQGPHHGRILTSVPI